MIRLFHNKLLLNFTLTFAVFLYYLPFINKGIILFDEGYMLHFAERILQGQVPYYDFFIQYTPGFFYILALFFKIFGTTILAGRIATLIISLAIVLVTLFLLDAVRLYSPRFKIIATIVLASFGFPLFNVPIDVWPCILLTVGLMLVFVKWTNASLEEWKYAFLSGVLLSLMLLVKQNLGVAYFAFVSLAFLFSENKTYSEKAKSIFLMSCVFILLSCPWIYYFFIRNHFLFTFLAFNKHFAETYPLSYPLPDKLLQIFGLFKLMPYYLPIFFFFLLIYIFIYKKAKRMYIYLAVFPLLGFALTVIPVSDLLHVYPFLGLTLIMFLVILQMTKLPFKKIYLVFILLTVLSGFYLALFKEQYRYGIPFRFDTTPINLPRTQSMIVDPVAAKQYTLLNRYINQHTTKDSYILVYPFSPMFYFMFDRQNPTRYANLLPEYATVTEENKAIKNIKKKKVLVVLTMGDYKFNKPLSQWIQKNTVQGDEYDGVFVRTVKQ